MKNDQLQRKVLIGLVPLGLVFLAACDQSPDTPTEQTLYDAAPLVLGEGKSYRFSPQIVDVNADGHLDIVSTHRKPKDQNSLHMWFGKGDGTFTEVEQTWPSPGYSALATGDINKDGNLDLVAASHFTSIHTFLGNGKGEFDHKELATQDGFVAVRLVDINKDGQDDLVTLGWQKAGIQIFHGDGTGTWEEVVQLMPGVIGRDLAVGDLDNDGDLDIAATMYERGLVTFFANEQGGWSGGPTGIAPGEKGTYARVALADINRDGRLDVAFNGGNAEARPDGPEVFLNSADGRWLKSSNGLKRFESPGMAIAIGDVDKDGHLDLVASASLIDLEKPDSVDYSDAWGLFVFNGDSQGNWKLRTESGLQDRGLNPARGAALGDLNGDGRLDVVVNHVAMNPRTPSLSVWLSR